MTTGLSLWALSANRCLSESGPATYYEKEFYGFCLSVTPTSDSLWLRLSWPNGSKLAFRAVYAPDGDLEIVNLQENDDMVSIDLSACTGKYHVALSFSSELLLRYTTRFTPSSELLFPYSPKDILVINKNHPHIIKGDVHIVQEGGRTGLIYFSTEGKGGSVLYQQDLTSLNGYCQETETSAGGTVGGTWPEIGFSLPVTKDKPLPAGKEFIISDAYITFSPEIPADDISRAKQFMDMLASTYRKLPKPETKYLDYPDLVKRSIEDIRTNYGCWYQIGNRSYLNAYVCDYKTPPEIMVQLAALLPIYDYAAWQGEEVGLEKKLLEGLPEFYDEKLHTVMRWLPAAKDNLDKSEEQKREQVMDSWYLHHPLLNLSRLALNGNKTAEKLFFNSLEFAINVAHHFNYQWPVFYNMQTLEVLKAETKPGNGGEKDVAGIYAAVMIQAWELTKEKRYLQEAENAARTLKEHGLKVFYQANNTAFSAKSLLKLYLITKNELYLDLSYLCIASIMKNVHIWECDYGYAKHYPTFFGLYPLNDAPYTAPYEEQEVFAAFHDYLQLAEQIQLSPSVTLLLTEYIKHFINRAAYYFPPLLPDEVISDEVKTGEISRNLHLALEDLNDGWLKSGAVGQEVYGAGLAFGITPRHYLRIQDKNLMIYTEYPVGKSIRHSEDWISFTILGDPEFNSRLRIIPAEGKKLPKLKVTAAQNGKEQDLKARITDEKHLEFTVAGNQRVHIYW